MDRVLVVPDAVDFLPPEDNLPTTLDARLEMLRRRQATMEQRLTQSLPMAINFASAPLEGGAQGDQVQTLAALGSFLVPEDLAFQLELRGVGTIVRDAISGFSRPPASSTTDPDPWQLTDIGLDESKRRACGRGVVVGIADSWLFNSHPDIPVPAESKAFDPSGNEITKPPAVISGHGSAVASLIAGPSIGVAPSSTIVFASVLRQPNKSDKLRFEGTPAQIAAGLEYLSRAGVVLAGQTTAQPVRIINASFVADPTKKGGDAMQKALDRLIRTGILLLAGTGNSGGTVVGYPARLREVIGVGALDRAGNAWPYTSQDGIKPDAWGPGIVRACGAGTTYQPWAGTSMATAIATGCAAAILSSDTSLNATQLRQRFDDWCNAFSLGKRLDLTELP